MSSTLAKVVFRSHNRVGPGRIQLTDLRNRFFAATDKTLNVIAHFVIATAKLFQLGHSCFVPNMFVLTSKFLTKRIKLIPHLATTGNHTTSRFRWVRLTDFDRMSLILNQVDFGFEADKDRTRSMIGVLLGFKCKVVPDDHFITQPYPLILDVSLYPPPATNLVVNFIQSLIQHCRRLDLLWSSRNRNVLCRAGRRINLALQLSQLAVDRFDLGTK